MASNSGRSPGTTVLSAVVPAVLTFGTAFGLSTLGYSTALAVGVGLVVGLVGGQVLQRVVH